ncbi:MAG TPA: peptidoglycan-binding domain-containing protein [Bryobacteraceae bacterium]|jgi:hypothetical protein|nr:peptidoglycan-binding domain-containing protein [Bryobacteraceae bacterium]
MKWALGLIAMGLALAPVPGLAQTATKKKSSSTHVSDAGSTTPKTATKKKNSTGSSTAVRTSQKSSHSGKGHHAAHRAAHAAAPAIQNHPEPERYLQIQQALSERGYFNGDRNGAWGTDSQDALQRFQTDNKLDADGKITALTLQNLGLGPKHDGSAMPLVGRPAPPQPAAVIPSLNAPSSVAPAVAEPAHDSQQTTSQTPSHSPAAPQQNR